ncbi:MAG: GGDEF domain-containing protein [Bosea sp. (in: a-proteobacteria)]
MSPGTSPVPADFPNRIISELGRRDIVVDPKSFDIWYRHLSGSDAELSSTIATHEASGKPFTGDVITKLYDEHMSSGNALRFAESSSRAVMMEIDGIVELIRLSLGSSSNYSKTLSSMLGDILTTSDPAHLKKIVQSLVKATEETRTVNEGLEKGLRNSRTEVEDLRKLLEDTRKETLKDALTGISNRKHFEQELQATIANARQSRSQFALLMIDIDHFKVFNDSHGHQTGDKVLRVVAQALRDKFPARATVARYGGEEFVVILPEADMMAGWVGAEAARQSILARELVKRSTGERIGRITISIGVGVWRRGDSGVTLIGRADNALLQAKRNGRNRTVTEDQAQAQVA